jgi:hypothetical protein
MANCFSYCEIEVIVNECAISSVTGGVIYTLPLTELVTILSSKIFAVTLLIFFQENIKPKQ